MQVMQETWVQSLGQEDPLEKGMVFLAGEFHGQRSLMGYSPWGHKESDTTEWLTLSLNPMTSVLVKVKVKITQLCPTLCDAMDYTAHRILQARILEWVAFPFSKGSSQLRDQTQDSQIAGRFFTSWATREAQEYWSG